MFIYSAKIIKRINGDGKVETSVNYPKLKTNVKLINNYVTEELYDSFISEEMTIDTGATISQLINTNYFNYITKEYNNEIKDDELRNDNLLLINENIIGDKTIRVEIASGEIIKKTEIYHDNESVYLLNDLIKVHISNTTVSYVKKSNNTNNKKKNSAIKFYYINESSNHDENEISLAKKKKLRNIKKENIKYTRPIENEKLLGLNILMQLNLTVTPIAQNSAIMVISDGEKLNNNFNLEWNQNYYDVYQIKSRFKLYCARIKDIFNGEDFISNEDSTDPCDEYSLNLDYLRCFDDENTMYHEEFETQYPINLLVLHVCNNKIKNEIKSKIENNEDIDGIIFREKIEPCSLKIWLKNNNNALKYKSRIKYNEFEPVNSIKYSLQDEFSILHNYTLSKWKIDTNLKNVIN